jgi:hypothetical protein
MTVPVVADLARLLERLAREEGTERRQVTRLEARLRCFQDEEQPAYDAWLRLVHGPLLSGIEELTAVLRARHMLAERVAELVADEGLHPREALYVLQEAGPAREPRRNGAPTADEIAARRHAKLERKRAERRRGKRARRGPGPPAADPAKGPADEPSRRRLLVLYRGLARRLHPDSPTVVHALAPVRRRAVWAEVQTAYAARSRERLLALATWLETIAAAGDDATIAGAPTDERSLSLAERHERLRALRRSSQALERRLDDLAREPAWDFARASPSGRRKLARAAERRLAAERDAIRAALGAVDEFLDGIGPPRPPRASRRR